MKNFINNNDGLTLVELLVGIVITSIAMAVVGSLFLTSTNFFNDFTSEKEAKMVVDSLYDKVSATLTYATDLTVSNSPETPTGWLEGDDDWIGFESYNKDGFLSTKETSNVYGKEFYANGYIRAKVSYANEITKKLTLQLQYYNVDDDVIYERNRTLNILNLTQFQTDMQGDSSVDNQNGPFYIHFKRQAKTVTNVGFDNDEYKIWTVFQRIYEETTKSNKDFYKTKTYPFPIQINGKVVGNCSNKHAYIGWQYRLDPQGAHWGDGVNIPYFMEMNQAKMQSLGVENLLTESKRTTMYMVPYHYVNNTAECDLLFYVYPSTYFDNRENNMERSTNLIYIQEENAWYYFKLNDTKGINGKCTSLKVGNSNKTAVPIDAGTVLTYTDDEGTKSATIESSYQIKLFFKQYGRKINI